MKKIFLFDLGNVIVVPMDVHELYTKLKCNISYEDFKEYWGGNDLVIKAHAGLVSDEVHIEALLKYCKSDLTIDDFYDVYFNFDDLLFSDTVNIIKELKKKNYTVGLLSNLRLMDFNRHKAQLEQFDFDYLFLSYEMKCIKPNKEIYEKVINTIGVEPENIVFFDDRQENVDAAREIGIEAYVATGNTIKDVFKNNFLI